MPLACTLLVRSDVEATARQQQRLPDGTVEAHARPRVADGIILPGAPEQRLLSLPASQPEHAEDRPTTP